MSPIGFCLIGSASNTIFFVQRLGTLLFTDDDEDKLGHGGPYQVTIVSSRPKDALKSVTIKFIKGKKLMNASCFTDFYL